jgi:hypothetical protein
MEEPVEQAERRSERGPRLVLGFDAGCMTCSELAKRIEDRVGDKIEIRSLKDPMMDHWRKEAFGEDAPWAPTLVEISGAVRAWTGVRMGVRLSRALGPLATWRVMQVLAEVNADLELVDSAAINAVSGFTRGQFLKGVGGAAVAMSVLSGTGSLAAPAAADEHWLSQLAITSSKELSREQAAAAWARQTRGRHLRRLLSSRVVNDSPAASRIRRRMLSAARTGVASPPTATIKGVAHEIEGGGQLLALAYQEDDALIVSYRFDKPDREARLISRVIEDESEELVRILAEAEDDDVFAAPQGATSQDGMVRATRGRRCRNGTNCGPCYGCRCVSASKRCLFNCCAACVFSCSNIWTCMACVGVWCPVCLAVNRCCYRKECKYISGC